MGLLGLMQLTMLHNIKIYCYLWSLPGIVGEEASRLDYSLWQVALTSLNRHACCLDAGNMQNNGSNCLLCQMSQECQSIGLAHNHNDQLWSGADSGAQDCVLAELDLSLCVAHAICNLEPFHKNLICQIVGKDQGLGDNRRSCRVFQHLG